jgi:hypothetical protein
MHEPREDKVEGRRDPNANAPSYSKPRAGEPRAPRDRRASEKRASANGGWRVFLTGALCGISFITIVALAWSKLHSEHSAEDAVIYDKCLMTRGDTVACNAMLRVIDRERIAAEGLKKDAAKLLAAGFTKREVVEWALKRGFVGSQLSDAVGISLEDLQAGQY